MRRIGPGDFFKNGFKRFLLSICLELTSRLIQENPYFLLNRNIFRLRASAHARKFGQNSKAGGECLLAMAASLADFRVVFSLVLNKLSHVKI